MPLRLNQRSHLASMTALRQLAAAAGYCDVAGGEWPQVAREAAKHLADDADEDSMRTLLLTDIRDVFCELCTQELWSSELAKALAEIEDRPWSEWGKSDKALSSNQLAGLLRPFRIKTKQLKREGQNKKGYRLDQFEDVFIRYTPPDQNATSLPRYLATSLPRYLAVMTRVSAEIKTLPGMAR